MAGGMVFSGILHASLFGIALGSIAWNRSHAPLTVDIDLTGASLLMGPANKGGRARPLAPPQPWILPGKGRPLPVPKAEPLPTQPVEEEAGPACPPPCPENAGDWMPAGSAARKPAWTEGMLTDADYPPDLRRKGIEGKVIAELLIDASGQVRGVTLVQGSQPGFEQLVLERLKRSKFRPAIGSDGEPVACRLRMPLSFKLRR